MDSAEWVEVDHEESLRRDVEATARIEAVPTILDVVCRITGMGFAAVARVTDTRWICCSSLDRLNFGVQSGDELEVATTICNEIRGHGKAVVIDHVAANARFCNHPTAARYGFQSYISFPIWRRNGEFFGTLCAIDPKPARIETPEVTGMFRLFGDLISFYLDQRDRLESSETALANANRALETELHERKVAHGRIETLLTQVIRSQEDERRRIAREIHDQLGQPMTALRMQLQLLQQQGGAAPPSTAALAGCGRLAEELDSSIDYLTWQFRPGAIEVDGLSQALADLVATWSQQFDIPAAYETDCVAGSGVALPPDAETHLYRLVQEALHNVFKHANAATVTVRFRRQQQLFLSITDDGIGFDVDRSDGERRGLGLANMRDRASLSGGELRIVSSPSRGTTIEVRFPEERPLVSDYASANQP